MQYKKNYNNNTQKNNNIKIENEYNTDLYHCRIGEWINTMGDKQAFIILLAL